MGWMAESGYELLLDDSNISATFPEFGISVVVIKRMSCVLGVKGHILITYYLYCYY